MGELSGEEDDALAKADEPTKPGRRLQGLLLALDVWWNSAAPDGGPRTGSIVAPMTCPSGEAGAPGGAATLLASTPPAPGVVRAWLMARLVDCVSHAGG